MQLPPLWECRILHHFTPFIGLYCIGIFLVVLDTHLGSLRTGVPPGSLLIGLGLPNWKALRARDVWGGLAGPALEHLGAAGLVREW